MRRCVLARAALLAAAFAFACACGTDYVGEVDADGLDAGVDAEARDPGASKAVEPADAGVEAAPRCTSTGWRRASSAENGPYAGPTWQDPPNVFESDDKFTRAVLSSGDSSLLIARDFGFVLPAGATIRGITVEVERATLSGSLLDGKVVLIRPDAGPSSTNRARAETWLSTPMQFYGGDEDTWGENWLRSDVESASFGAALSVHLPDGVATAAAEVDRIRMAIRYCE